MGLSEIAAGLEVTDEQRDRGVATVDRAAATLTEGLASVAEELPCGPESAATVVEAYAGGRSVGDSARAAEVAPVTGAKVLHLVGEPVTPVGPTGREVVRDWLDAALSRREALELADLTDREFALAVYVETHEPIPDAREAVEGVLSVECDAAVEKRERLGETMSDVGDLR